MQLDQKRAQNGMRAFQGYARIRYQMQLDSRYRMFDAEAFSAFQESVA